jgi:chemotaxis protein CheD
MTPSFDRLPALYLRPGDWFVGKKLGLVRTILGSCVAVTMFHWPTRHAAICHAVMPVCVEKRHCGGFCENSSKYAGCIVHNMVEAFAQQGLHSRDIEVKLFGGADGLTNGNLNSSGVGRRNIEEAMKAIQNARLTLKLSDVGGFQGRKLFFDTNTGEVLLKRLSRAQLDSGEWGPGRE